MHVFFAEYSKYRLRLYNNFTLSSKFAKCIFFLQNTRKPRTLARVKAPGTRPTPSSSVLPRMMMVLQSGDGDHGDDGGDGDDGELVMMVMVINDQLHLVK